MCAVNPIAYLSSSTFFFFFLERKMVAFTMLTPCQATSLQHCYNNKATHFQIQNQFQNVYHINNHSRIINKKDNSSLLTYRYHPHANPFSTLTISNMPPTHFSTSGNFILSLFIFYLLLFMIALITFFFYVLCSIW